ncbi:uncharacterized protein LOC134185597 isoform X1 [Corticium candelabrum]|uniref:uncharacterized protein LOC134185597 isoform X1 n=1 Tax=Corticium candelabrum TaxID=121492 RepID=UPI002E27490E|nr:uncharacterized protein LOC134185597 isoform X1 [Corticium candelabrum]
MHAVFEGVFKHLLFFWFSSEFHHKAFYIGRHQREIDVQLTRICVPHDFGRKPRSLEDMKHFKATEFHDVMLYFMLPLVQPYLPVDHFHHFAILITAITILLSESTENEIKLAGILLDFFVYKMESLYGFSAMTMNVHSLTHLSQQVSNTGPLWCNSIFSI